MTEINCFRSSDLMKAALKEDLDKFMDQHPEYKNRPVVVQVYRFSDDCMVTQFVVLS